MKGCAAVSRWRRVRYIDSVSGWHRSVFLAERLGRDLQAAVEHRTGNLLGGRMSANRVLLSPVASLLHRRVRLVRPNDHELHGVTGTITWVIEPTELYPQPLFRVYLNGLRLPRCVTFWLWLEEFRLLEDES
jgi:hypothetical protein